MDLGKRARPPRFLPDVLQAIYELKETGGSNSTKIVNFVKETVNCNNRQQPKPRNISTQVQRALSHAISTGIVKKRAGKFRINTARIDPQKDCAKCRRRGKKGHRKSGKRRGRKRTRKAASPKEPQDGDTSTPSLSSFLSENDSQKSATSDDMSSDGTSNNDDEVPVYEGRRRRKRRKGSAGGRRKRRRSAGSRQQRARRSQTPMPPGGFQTDPHKFDGTQDIVYPDDLQHNAIHGESHCDNPECLCNSKTPLRQSHSAMSFHDHHEDHDHDHNHEQMG